MKSFALFISYLFCLAMPGEALAASYQSDLEPWIARELMPYVGDQLSTQPRFKNESVRFVVLADENPQSASNQLAMSIRDRMRDMAAKKPGLDVVWQRDLALAASSGNIDCTKDQAHYLVGVEVIEDRSGLVSVVVRALDIEEQHWVSGFGKSWRGYLNKPQRRQLQQFAVDVSYRGDRDAPFDETQFDLLASRLAYELGCALLRQTAGEYVVSTPEQQTEDAAEAAMLELVRNNLADFRAAQYASNADLANAVINGKAHQVDDELYQYWVTITPDDANSELTAISASAYIRVADKYAVAAMIPSVNVSMGKSDVSFLSTLRVVEMRDTRSCLATTESRGNSQVFDSGYATSAVDCYALEIASSSNSVLFFLNHQLNNGLVRLSQNSCTGRTDARIARGDEQLHFPLPIDTLMSGSWAPAQGWELNPDKDTYYVIAASDTKAARAISLHIGQLPNRCSASVRSGFEGRELRRWMDEFAAITKHWKQAVDWQVIRVKNIY
jgi:hypothetical protein